jgi:endonuclease V
LFHQNGKRKTPNTLPNPVTPITFSEQTRLAKQVIQKNNLTFSPTPPFTGLNYIAGVDISFVKSTQKACAMLTILNYPSLTLAYKTHDIVEMTEEYIPYYLAFREVRHLVQLFDRVKQKIPEMYPQIVFVDGAGVWHPQGPHYLVHGWCVGLGLASHLGVLLDIPTIGIAKSLLYIPDIPSYITYSSLREAFDITPTPAYISVVGESGKVYGAAVIPRQTTTVVEKPIYVSVGHLLELDTAVELVHATAKYRIPEAIRAADWGSREVLRLLEEKQKEQGNEVNES